MDQLDPIVYLNGALLPLSEAKIPVLDRGFIFGDGVYEVVPVYHRKMFCAKEHMARLSRSLAAIHIPNPYDTEQWLALIETVSAKRNIWDQLIYIQVTRGVAPRAHAFPQEITPTVLIMANPLTLPTEEMRTVGVRCVSFNDARWLHCDIKATSLLGNVLAAQHAVEHHVSEVIQFRDGYLTEGAASNVWVVKNNTVMAPVNNHLILEGIRYGIIEKLCQQLSLSFCATDITKKMVEEADEIWLSSASKEILPVTYLDDKIVGSGMPGPLFKQMYHAYQQAKHAAD